MGKVKNWAWDMAETYLLTTKSTNRIDYSKYAD